MISLSKELKIQNREGTPINLSMDAVIDYGFVDSVINKKDKNHGVIWKMY